MIFRITDGEGFGRWAEAKVKAARKKAVLLAAQHVVQTMTAEIIPNLEQPPIDTRQYAGGWRATPGTNMVSIANSTPQAVLIEEGVRAKNVKPGRLMIDALAAWAKRKGFTPEANDPTGRGLAFAIARNMQKRGIFKAGKGFHVLQRGMTYFAAYFREEFRAALAEELKKGS